MTKIREIISLIIGRVDVHDEQIKTIIKRQDRFEEVLESILKIAIGTIITLLLGLITYILTHPQIKTP